jgi:ParB family chromosome partitioning protein
MGKTVVIANQKGGVGKTTTAVNLSASLALADQDILVVDTDPQGNLSSGLGINRSEIGKSLYDVYTGRLTLEEAVCETLIPHLHIVPSNIDLLAVEVELVSKNDREKTLLKALSGIKERYRYIFIDCPPSLGLLTLNGLVAADSIIVPVQCEYYSLEGLSLLTRTLKLVRSSFNPDLAIEGILLTMFDSRNTLSHQVAEEVRKYFGERSTSARSLGTLHLERHRATENRQSSTTPGQRAHRVTWPWQRRYCMKAALGKGLDALLPDRGDEVIGIEIGKILPNEHQPRKVFRDEALKELASSIKEKGVLQPVIVSRIGDGNFRLIAGERRWRASSLAGLKRIPALIKEVSSQDAIEIALIENIQREELNAIETADAFYSLMQDFKLTQEALAERVGKDRATVANYLRILKLPGEIKALINDGSLSLGHAKALLSLDDKQKQIEIASKIVQEGLSVRAAEALCADLNKQPSAKAAKPAKKENKKLPEVADLEDKLIQALGTKVRLQHKGVKGKIEIEYYSLDELDRLLELFLSK